MALRISEEDSISSIILPVVVNRAKRKIKSKTLRGSLKVRRDGNSINPFVIKLIIPFFYAIYVHEGRKAPMSRGGKLVYVWFKNIFDDPRLVSGRFPQKRNRIPRLTKDQFNFFMDRNIRSEIATYGRRRRSGEKQVGPMIVTPTIRKSTPPDRFFSSRTGGGMYQMSSEINLKRSESIIRLITSTIPSSVRNSSLSTTYSFL